MTGVTQIDEPRKENGAYCADEEIADEELNSNAGWVKQNPDPNPTNFSNFMVTDNASLLQVGNNYGNISAYFVQPETIFGTLAIQDHQKSFLRSICKTSSKKAYLQANRRSQQTTPTRYKPYTKVTNGVLKKRLMNIARRLRLYEYGFAEYFRSVVPSFDREYVQQWLKNTREDITKRQNSNKPSEERRTVYLGDLGEFCEAVSKTWNDDPNQNGPRAVRPEFDFTHRVDREIFAYLQDALEIGYWNLMLDIFLHWRTTSKSLIGNFVLMALESLEGDLINSRNQLLSDIEAQSEDSFEDLAPIIEGIDKRIALLGSMSDLSDNSGLEMPRLLAPSTPKPDDSQPTSPEQFSVARPSAVIVKEKENVGLIALILIFLIAAVVPGYKGFSISMGSTSPGSVYDADFMYLIQSSLMSVLGNLVMVIPLMKNSFFSPAYGTMWIFFTLGLLFAVVSIVIYPLANTGWSSMVAFFSSIASVTSVLVMTQDAGRDGSHKLKED